MAAAYGLYTHIQSNRRRSIALLIGLFFLVYVMVFAGALAAAAMMYDASLEWLLRARLVDAVMAAPFATVGAALWILIAYKFHQSLIDMVTGGHDVTRQEEPRLYNLLENLCISRGIPMPKLKIMESPALNAFASGMNEKQYAVTVTTGLLEALDDAEIEAVLGHELTHIRNGDVRMLVIAVIIAGVISFFAEFFFRMLFYSRGGSRSLRRQRSRQGRRRHRDRDRDRADRARLVPLGGDPLCAVAQARIPRRCGRGGADQESRRHDLGAAQDREPRRAGRRDLRRDGDVRRQSARGLRGPVRHASLRRQRASTRWCKFAGGHDPGPLAVPQFDGAASRPKQRRTGVRSRPPRTGLRAVERRRQAVPAAAPADRARHAGSGCARASLVRSRPWGPQGGSR